MAEPKRYIYCFGDVIILLKCVQRERMGQIFGSFQCTYFMGRLLEENYIKQRLRYSKIIDIKLSSAVNPQIMKNNAGKQFSTCK